MIFWHHASCHNNGGLAEVKHHSWEEKGTDAVGYCHYSNLSQFSIGWWQTVCYGETKLVSLWKQYQMTNGSITSKTVLSDAYESSHKQAAAVTLRTILPLCRPDILSSSLFDFLTDITFPRRVFVPFSSDPMMKLQGIMPLIPLHGMTQGNVLSVCLDGSHATLRTKAVS